MSSTRAAKHESGDATVVQVGALRTAPEMFAASFESLRAALMTTPSPRIVFTTEGDTVLVNHAFEEVAGFGLQDLPTLRACLALMRRIPLENLDAAVQGWILMRSHGSNQEVTVWTARDEARVWQINYSDPILWPDGNRVIVLSVFDITEQRRLEDVLRRNEEELRMRLAELEMLYASAPVGIAMLDRDLKYVHINQALANLNGLPLDSYAGVTPFSLMPQLRGPLEKPLRSVLETGQPILNLEFESDRPNAPGVVRNWLEHIYPLRDASGATTGVGVIVKDITDRKEAQRELGSANVALRRTLDLLFLSLRIASVSVFTQDACLNYIWIGGDYFGCDPDEAVNRTDAELLPPELVEPMVALKRRVVSTGEPASGDMPYEKDGKVRWCNVHVEPWRSQNGAVQSILGAVTDVTERKATEHHIRTLLSELAHRSKNLLTVIQVMARRSVSPGLPSTAFVDSFVERLSGLAQSHDLLAREDWRGTSMHELVTSQIGHLKTELSDRLTIKGPDVVLTPVAAQNLGMAIHELSTNAIKYGALSTASGQVRITWSVFRDEEGRDRIRLSWVERGGPIVSEPTRRGFGRFVIEAIAARALSGVVDLRFEPEGVSCIIEGAADASVIAQPAASPARAV